MPDPRDDPELLRALAALTGPELACVTGNVLKVFDAILQAAAPLEGSETGRAVFDDLLRWGVLRPEDRGRRVCYLRHMELARRAGLSKNTVTRCTGLLVRLGLVEKRVARLGSDLPSNFFLLPAGRTAATTKGSIAMEFVVALYEKTIGPASAMIREELAPLVEQYTAEEWAAAFRQAAWSNVLRLTYVVKVLEGRAATTRGTRGLDLCHGCYRRILRQEEAQRQAARQDRPFEAGASGPPYEWPRCELCGDDVDDHGLGYYTVDNKRRRFCSVECRQLRNSRVSAPQHAVTMRQRVRSGLWTSPLEYTTHDERTEYAARGGEARAVQVRAEIEQGTWMPSYSKHAGNPVLFSAKQKLSAGGHVSDLTDAERDAYRLYMRELRARDRERVRLHNREYYRRCMSDPDKRATAQARYGRQRQKRDARPPNLALIRAREAAGLTCATLAATLGVHRQAVRQWELHSAVPRDPDLRRRVADLLGTWPWPEVAPDR